MPCYAPLQGWRSKYPNPNGKRTIVFTKSEGDTAREVTLPCGKCEGCGLEYARQWAVRCMHESQMHEKNCFITLTYSDEKLPKILGRNTLVKEHFVKFMKRLRKKYGNGIRFFASGEYGDGGQRLENPHYHACIFGHDFDDKIIFKHNENGDPIYVSQELNQLWTDPEDGVPYGFATVAAMTFETASYTARYTLKKRLNKKNPLYYDVGIDPHTDEVISICPEFALMSRRPGVGALWYDQWKWEVKTHDEIIVRGMQQKPPMYYMNRMEQQDPEIYKKHKLRRKIAQKNNSENSTCERLHVREYIKVQKIKMLKGEL